tara:strand:+ start:3285 stop:4406 length:1122 start_codon:yes stop_codon:yes gene_type:complete
VKRINNLLIVGLLFIGCSPTSTKTTFINSTQYAQGFSIEKKENYKILSLKNTVPSSSKVFRYLLISKENKIPQSLNYDGIIRTPVKRIVATSTTHLAFLEELNATESLVGFPQINYISSVQIRKQIDAGKVIDVGMSQQLNVERILEVDPDILLSFGVDQIDNSLKRFNRMGIPTAFIGEWNEQDPLGRAEWIKVFGVLLGKEKEAFEVFKNTEKKYIEAKKSALEIKSKPTLIAGAIYQDAWYLPGGKSYLAKLFEDANTNYLWKDNTQTGSLALSIEAVLQKGKNSNYWFAPGQHTSYSTLTAEHALYSKFEATQKRKIFTYARSKGSTGGIIFFESGACHPDLVLKDIIHHIYPNLEPDYIPTYFLPLDD